MANVPAKQDSINFLKWMEAEEVMVCASADPHCDRAELNGFPSGFNAEFRRKIMVENTGDLCGARSRAG